MFHLAGPGFQQADLLIQLFDPPVPFPEEFFYILSLNPPWNMLWTVTVPGFNGKYYHLFCPCKIFIPAGH